MTQMDDDMTDITNHFHLNTEKITALIDVLHNSCRTAFNVVKPNNAEILLVMQNVHLRMLSDLAATGEHKLDDESIRLFYGIVRDTFNEMLTHEVERATQQSATNNFPGDVQ